MSLALPQEIIDLIVSFLPTRDGRKALKSTSLVCRSFLPSTRARLFQRIDVCDHDKESTKLDILLERAPHLLHYVKVLRIILIENMVTGVGLFARSSTLPTSLKALSNGPGCHHVTLKKIELYGVDWGKMSSDMQAVLLDLLSCSSLCQVVLRGVSNCPASLFDCLPLALKILRISDSDILLSKNFRPMFQLEISTMFHYPLAKKLPINVSQIPLEWFPRIRSLTLSMCNKTLWSLYRPIIQCASSSLEELYIRIDIQAKYFSFVDFGQFPRIRKIIIVTSRSQNWSNCFVSLHAAIVWLAQSLSNVSHENNMDCVTIRFPFINRGVWKAAQFDAKIKKAAWQSLDETLSQPNLASSKIFRGINFQICASSPIYDCLKGLVVASLPRMETSKKLHITHESLSKVIYDIDLS